MSCFLVINLMNFTILKMKSLEIEVLDQKTRKHDLNLIKESISSGKVLEMLIECLNHLKLSNLIWLLKSSLYDQVFLFYLAHGNENRTKGINFLNF